MSLPPQRRHRRLPTPPPPPPCTRQTIVNFPVKNLELRPYTAGPPPLLLGGRRVALPSPEAVAAMPVAQLRALLAALHAPPPPAGALEKAELVALAQVGG